MFPFSSSGFEILFAGFEVWFAGFYVRFASFEVLFVGFEILFAEHLGLKSALTTFAGAADVVFLFQVRDEIVFQPGFKAANLALFFVVAKGDVLLDVLLVFGLEVAEFALVRLFAGMLLHVLLQIVLEGGGVVADFAAEGLLRVVHAQYVLLEVLQLRRLEAAELALESYRGGRGREGIMIKRGNREQEILC